MTDQPHSAEYFGAFRDYWWNADFLNLCAERYRLAEVRDALDVGCGVGHWGRLLAPFLPTARLTGIDREPEWVTEAATRAAEAGLDGRFAYLQADAARLPFPDGAFDLVTCQTVLIHVADARTVLREMLRVLAPGGLLLAVEPNPLAGRLALDSLSAARSADDIAEDVWFELTCLRGKARLGLGDGMVADELPGLLGELGLSAIQVHVSDKASPLVPPYDSEEQRVLVAQYLDWARRAAGPWDRTESLRYFLAGGGAAADFDAHWDRAARWSRAFPSAVEAKSYRASGASLMYLVSGRKR